MIKRKIKAIFTCYPFENIICLFTQGKNVHSFIGKLAPTPDFYPKKTIRQTNRNGINYSLDISDYQNWLIYFGFTNDRPVGLFELIRPNQVILDIGANIGQTALEFAKLSGKESIVFAFEPHPGNFAAAKTNLALNDFSNIKLLNIGLGSNKTKLPITTGDHNSGSNKISSESNSNTTVVDIEKLDDILEIKNLTKIDLIKIDVEGFEMEVLKGAELTIRKFNPILFIELDDNNLKNQMSSANELVLFLKNLNFLIMDSETEQVISESTNFENCHFDIICKPLAV